MSRDRRIVWRSFGLVLAVDAPASLAARVRARLPVGRPAPASSPPGRAWRFERTGTGWRVWRDRRVMCRALPLAAALDALESDAQLWVAEHAPDRLFVHAGVVVTGGRALVLPGRSFAGKSTLVRALVRAGATYYSDEYAVFDANARVHAYPRPLAVRGPAGRRLIPAPRQARPPRPVAQILLTRYKPGATRPLRRLAPGRAVLALFKNTVAARSRAAFALSVLTRISASANAWYGQRGEAADLAAQLLHGERTARTARPARPRRR